MSSPNPRKPNPAENWEDKLKEIQAEESYKKLNPKQQAELEAKEKAAFEKSKELLRKSLGYSKFVPPAPKSEQLKTTEQEKTDQEFKEAYKLNEESSRNDNTPELLEKTDHKKESAEQKKMIEEQKKEFENPERMKEFLKTFSECLTYIQKKTDLKFPTYSIDHKGEFAEQTAHCLKITDHSQIGDLKPDVIAQRLKDKKTHPLNIGLVVEIGNVKENSLNMHNISMEIPLSSLKAQDLISQLQNFTNTVLFAMLCYDQQKKASPESVKLTTPKNPNIAKPIPLNDTAKKAGLEEVNEGGKVTNNNSFLEIGDNSLVCFQCNGQVWGNFDLKKAEKNNKNLPEQIEDIKREK